jgi:hypothetical protein
MKPTAGWESKLLRVQPPAATVSAFEAAYRALQAAEDKAAKAMQAQYPVGYRRISAKVVSHCYGLRLKVRGMSGKEYPINASRLL